VTQTATTPARLTPERLNTGFRVWTRCSDCGEKMALDSKEKPNEEALKLASFAFVCDACDAKITAAEEARNVTGAIEARLKACGLPNDLLGLTFDQMDRAGSRRTAVVAAHAWAENGKGGLLLYGPVGVGKTRLAATAAFKALTVRPVRWVSVPILLAKATAAWSAAGRNEATAILTGNEALVLDDLGKEKPSDWARQLIFAAVDHRIQQGAPLIVTSNFEANELADRMGDWIGSRLAGYCSQYKLEGKDRRL
jgi:DNA replication protein DnaC